MKGSSASTLTGGWSGADGSIFDDVWPYNPLKNQSKFCFDEKINENLRFFPSFGCVLRTAAKNRKKRFMNNWYFFQFLAACCAPLPKNQKMLDEKQNLL